MIRHRESAGRWLYRGVLACYPRAWQGRYAEEQLRLFDQLAREVQVLVITHSPQVAALADRHFLIRKTATRSAATTEVVELDARGRREEIARMISGAEVTAEARAAADRLLGATAEA